LSRPTGAASAWGSPADRRRAGGQGCEGEPDSKRQGLYSERETASPVARVVSDVQSYASGGGPFGQTFYQNPTVIGVVEAHGLAVLTAGTLWFLATRHNRMCSGHSIESR